MSNLTFLTQEQWVVSGELDIFKKRGTKAAITDFAIALGGFVSSSHHVDSDTSLKGRTGEYWTKSDDGDNDALMIDCDEYMCSSYVYNSMVGARPDLPF